MSLRIYIYVLYIENIAYKFFLYASIDKHKVSKPT